jgi:hypothetical protein
MAHRDPSDDASIWEDVRQRIERWRETRTHRGLPMPAALWAAAVRLARQHGVGVTARALRVDQGSLKQRVVDAGGEVTTRPTFVEVAVPAPAGRAPSVIVVEGARGRRLRLEVSDLGVADLVALLHAAWDGPR